MIRKPVVLITGADGEIGHGLITRLARDGTREDRHARRQPARARAGTPGSARVHGLDPRHLAARTNPGGIRGGARLPPGGAALDALGVHAADGASRQRRGHAEPARVRAARRGVARATGRLRLSLVDCRLRPAGPRDAGQRRARAGRRVDPSGDDVWLQQAVLRAARARTTRGTTSSSPPGHR